ncbi:hypothetical protein BGZ91_000930 [Linnemannia elongata]|nr:hypothetical protein BGZ91_000930 [Linnemannia elongata]
MAATSSPGMALLEKTTLIDPTDITLSETASNASDIEKLVIRSLQKLVDLFSSVDDQTEPYDPTDEDEVTELTEADPIIEDIADNTVESANERGVDTAQNPSAESGEDADVDPIAFFKVEAPIGSPLETNDCIQRESHLFGEPLVDDHMIKFWLSLEGYQEWLQQHQREISTNFIQLKGSYKFISKKRTGGQHIYLQCQRAGVQRERKGRTKGGKSGKPRVRQSSIKIGCPAKLQVVTQKRPGPNGGLQVVYEVTYLYQHNHGVGCFSSVGTRQKSEAIRATIKNLILGGSTISMVMHQLTMEHDKFTQIMRQKGRFSRDDFITYDDVYNIWHKIMVTKMRKDDDPIVSSAKWMEELEKEGAFTYYDKGDHVGGLYFGFSTIWQMNQLKAYGRTICFDGTHDVFGQKTNLFTLVVKNATTGFGVPVAFLLTNTQENSVLVGWLRGLRSKMTALFSSPDQVYTYTPNAVITDQGNVEILAIKRAFAGEDVRIFFCAWHVYRVWEREVPKRILGISHLPLGLRNHIKAAAVSELRSILQEPELPKALQGIQLYRQRWLGKWQGDLIQYLDKKYFGSAEDVDAIDIQKHWMTCYRQDVSYSHIDTNNYIDSWHNILKRHFFRDRQQRRPDTVIYILAYMAIPHFQQKCNRSILKVGRMTPAQKIEERFRSIAAKHLEVREPKGDPVEQIDCNTLHVESFTAPEKKYTIQVDFTKIDTGEITSCSCPYFGMHLSCCKHIALVLLLIPQMQLKCVELDLQENRTDNKRRALDAQREYTEYLSAADDSMPDRGSMYLKRANQLESLKNKDTSWRNQDKIDSLMAQVVRLMEEEVNADITVKRQKQEY